MGGRERSTEYCALRTTCGPNWTVTWFAVAVRWPYWSVEGGSACPSRTRDSGAQTPASSLAESPAGEPGEPSEPGASGASGTSATDPRSRISRAIPVPGGAANRSEEHTSELQSLRHL